MSFVAPTPSPASVRGLLLHAVWYYLQVETGDMVCALMQGDSSSEMFARPPKGQEREGCLGFEYRRYEEPERKAFAVKRNAKYVDKCLDLVHLQNAKPVVTPLTEHNIHNWRSTLFFGSARTNAVVRDCESSRRAAGLYTGYSPTPQVLHELKKRRTHSHEQRFPRFSAWKKAKRSIKPKSKNTS